jgi:hypothetical protein
VTGDIDLLSIDLDGMDFWMWRALSDITPRVVVIEYNNRFPAEISATVPYDPQFQGTDLMTGEPPPCPRSPGQSNCQLCAS